MPCFDVLHRYTTKQQPRTVSPRTRSSLSFRTYPFRERFLRLSAISYDSAITVGHILNKRFVGLQSLVTRVVQQE